MLEGGYGTQHVHCSKNKKKRTSSGLNKDVYGNIEDGTTAAKQRAELEDVYAGGLDRTYFAQNCLHHIRGLLPVIDK